MRIGSRSPHGRLLKYVAAALFACSFGGSGAAAAGAIEEVTLPEGVSAPYAIAVDPAGRVWFAEKIGKALSGRDRKSVV